MTAISIKPTSLSAAAVSSGMVSALALAAGGAAEAQGLDGVYAGISGNLLFGNGVIGTADGDEYTFEGAGSIGAFIGYQTDLANGWTGGFEFSIQSGARMDAEAASDPEDGDYRVNTMMDFRLRLACS